MRERRSGSSEHLLLVAQTVKGTSARFMKRPNGNCFQYLFLSVRLAILLVTAAIQSHAQTGGEPIVIGKKFEIHSKVLNETRSLLVATPEGYDQEKDLYPVLYVLDGDENFVQAVGIVRSLDRERPYSANASGGSRKYRTHPRSYTPYGGRN
jgi:hypothetical protein